jgi:alkylated DNA repair dioxygenase AlkB
LSHALPIPGFDYRSDFLPAGQADRLLETLWREVPWRAQSIRLFGREVLQPRLIAWYADEGVRYSYSGLELQGQPWHAGLAELREVLQQQLGSPFNSVLLNAYRDGRDSMGWHADDEPELGAEPVIASLSLGATRRLLVRRGRGGPSSGLDLEHGSLLLMHGQSQARFQHSVPKTRRAAGLRLNLTFRLIR